MSIVHLLDDDTVNKIFGGQTDYVKVFYLDRRDDGRYDLKPEFNTQRKIEGVFAGKECRTAEVSDDDGLVFLTVPGENQTQLTFRIADGEGSLGCDATLEYNNDGICGTIDAPIVLNAMLTGISDVNSDTAGSELYDLQGRRVYRQTEGVQRSTLKKGVYIEDGQKRVKK